MKKEELKSILKLMQNLLHTSPEVVVKTSLELEKMGRKLAVPFFKLWDETTESEKFKTIEILSKTKYAITAKKASQKFLDEDNSKLKASLVTLVGKTGTSSHIPVLAHALRDEDKRIRANAVEAISEIGGREIIDLLLPLLEDPSNRVKANTAKALWEFDEVRDMVRKVFEDMVADDSKWMKASAYYAFGEVGIMEFFNLLVDSLDEEDEDIARNAVVALIGYADKFGDIL